jgi:hypothetical protein
MGVLGGNRVIGLLVGIFSRSGAGFAIDALLWTVDVLKRFLERKGLHIGAFEKVCVAEETEMDGCVCDEQATGEGFCGIVVSHAGWVFA